MKVKEIIALLQEQEQEYDFIILDEFEEEVHNFDIVVRKQKSILKGGKEDEDE